MEYLHIAIDGPSASGKSTLARNISRALRIAYIDTGALYRAVALAILREGVDCNDRASVVSCLSNAEILVAYEGDVQQTFLSGENVSEAIRQHEVSETASIVSSYPEVRDHLIGLQRGIAATRSCILDGRDIGTVVLPEAQIKFFLAASVEERARRRYAELMARGQLLSFDTVLHDIRLRDERDRTRAVAPLRPAEDSILLDTTELTAEQSAQRALAHVDRHLSLLGFSLGGADDDHGS